MVSMTVLKMFNKDVQDNMSMNLTVNLGVILDVQRSNSTVDLLISKKTIELMVSIVLVQQKTGS